MTRILVAEDDAAIRGVIQEALEERGFEVLVAENGQDALEIAREHRPHLVLMDLMLPRIDGVAATCLLKSNPDTSWIRIIAMSAGMNLRFFSDYLPADSILGKPFDLDTLLANVSMQLRNVQSPDHLDVI